MPSPSVRELYFYPVKSLRGLRTKILRLNRFGPLWDREWMIVDEDGRFVTQRKSPELAKISLTFDEESSLELSTRDMGSVDFGLEEREGPALEVKVWSTLVEAFEVSRDVSAWLSEVVGLKLRLVHISPNAQRIFNPKFPERYIRFADQQPLLVIAQNSLVELEKKAGMTLSMIRFRPNIVLDDVPAHAEDEWSGFKIGDLEFKALKPCSRCSITTVHPLSGKVSEEPLKTLATYRRQERGIMFGYYYAHLSDGEIKLGASVSPH